MISNAGAGCSSSSASWSPVGISVHAVSPFAHVWMAGNASVSPAFSGICSESSKASRCPSGSGVFAVYTTLATRSVTSLPWASVTGSGSFSIFLATS